MRYIKNILVVCLLAIASVIAPVTLADQANAATGYDSAINPVGALRLYGDPGCDPINLSSTWEKEITSRYTGAELDSFVNRKAWVVTAGYKPGSNVISSVSVAWWGPNDEGAVAEFSSESIPDKTFNKLSITSGTTYFERFRQSPGQCGVLMNEGLDMQDGVSLGTEVQPAGSSAYYLERPFEVAGVEISYPTGYEGVYAPGPSAYVAMGDSYSSGEGVVPFEDGSDTMANTCHRSSLAYPRLLQNSLDLGPTTFVACSGAVSDYIIDDYNQENVEHPQAIYVNEGTKLVTISIGGNDVGFPGAMTTCVASSTAQDCLDALSDVSDKVSDPAFLTKIKDVLSGIRSLGGAGTDVVSVGYPQLFAAYGDISGSCTWGDSLQHNSAPNQVSGRAISQSEIIAMRQLHDDLNGVLALAVSQTSDSHLHFADPTASFQGHEVCGGLSDWMNGVTLLFSTADIGVASFHPNSDGQEAYAEVVEDAIANF